MLLGDGLDLLLLCLELSGLSSDFLEVVLLALDVVLQLHLILLIAFDDLLLLNAKLINLVALILLL